MEMINQTIDQILKEGIKKFPEKDFIVYSDRDLHWSYSDFDQRVQNLAKGLLSIGIQKGDHIGVWATNIPDWLTLLFATARIGVVLVTINTGYKKYELEYIIRQSDMKTLFLMESWRDSNYVEILYDVIPELKEYERGRLNCPKLPCFKSAVLMGPEKHRGFFNIEELILRGSYLNDSLIEAVSQTLDCHDVINIQYTAGTKGYPKGVCLTHYNIINNGYHIGDYQKFTPDEKLCLSPPLFHCFGLVLGVMAVLTHHATLVMIEQFTVLSVFSAIENEGCTALYGVPTMFIAELNHPMFDRFNLSTLRTGIMAGAPCPMETMKQVVEKMHMSEVTIAYGLTEASPVVTQTKTDDSLENRVSTVGKELPGVEVRIENPDTGEECPTGVEGEICCRGYSIMKGYYKLPEDTAETIDKEGWLHTGDLGVKNSDGFYRITGRIKDMIIRGGENIYPREIEIFLSHMPEIKEIYCAGVPDIKYGEQVGVFVIPRKKNQIKSIDVKNFCKGNIARYKIPKYVFFVESFPSAKTTKELKDKLTALALELTAK